MIMSTMRALLLSLIFITAAEAKHTKGRSRSIATFTRGGMPNVQAQSAVVVDLSGNEELFTKNPDEVRPIASISKLMAILVVLDHNLDMDATTVMTESDKQIATGGARSRLPV